MQPPVTPAEIEKALAGIDPPGDKRSLAVLGKALADHRNGRNAGVAYSKQAIALYKSEPEKQGDDFVEAFLSWRVAERTRQPLLRLRYNGIAHLVDDTAHLVQAGDGEPDAIMLIADIPEGTLIVPPQNGTGVPLIVLCAAGIRSCQRCGQRFIQRSWNHRYCTETCATITYKEKHS